MSTFFFQLISPYLQFLLLLSLHVCVHITAPYFKFPFPLVCATVSWRRMNDDGKGLAMVMAKGALKTGRQAAKNWECK